MTKLMFDLLQRYAYLIRGDKRFIYYDSLKRNLLMSRSGMVELQNDLVHKLIQHAYMQTVYYREVMSSMGLTPDDIRSKEDLMKMPVLTKSLIRDNLDRMKSNDRFGKRLRVVTSGGSTGNQAVVYHSPYFTQVSRAAALRNNSLTGWMPHDKSVWIWGASHEHQQLRDSIKARIGVIVNRRLFLNAFSYSVDEFELWARKIKEFKPTVLYGYASIVLEFSRFLLSNGLFLDSIKRVVTTSEKLSERNTIAAAFRCDVFDQYGAREVLAVGIETKKGIMRIADDVVALNVSDEGHFLITALHSYGFPLINYKIGDCGWIDKEGTTDETDPIPFTNAKITIGRISDNFLTEDKKPVTCLVIAGYLGELNLAVLDQQIIQKDFKVFTVNYVPDKGLVQSSYHESVNNVLSEHFGSDLVVEFNAVNKIEVEPSGKKLMFKRTFNF
jgi:phenylacetate-CoA ligase